MTLITGPLVLLFVVIILFGAWKNGKLENLMYEIPELKFLMGIFGSFPIALLIMFYVFKIGLLDKMADTEVGIFLMLVFPAIFSFGSGLFLMKKANHRQALAFGLTGLGISFSAAIIFVWWITGTLKGRY